MKTVEYDTYFNVRKRTEIRICRNQAQEIFFIEL